MHMQFVHQMFEDRVRDAPDAIAVTAGAERLTYAELNGRANRLAHLLRDRGAGPGVLVGVCIERSVDLVVAILAILKSGAAYLPLDPQYPDERLALMLQDSQVPLLVSERAQQGKLPPAAPGLDVLVVEDLGPQLAGQPAENPPGGAGADDLAYVIYTSGSTGRPKGVLIDHTNVARLFTATEQWFHFGPSDVTALFHSAAFDLSVWEMWGALAYGGQLVVVPHPVSRSFEQFYDLVVREGVTVLTHTPTAFKQFAAADELAGPGSRLALRFVVFAGEALNIPTLRPWFERHGDQVPRLVNMYGITETTVHSTYREIDLADTGNAASVIGVAIPDLQLYVLDEDMRPVADGEVGELYVGGPGVGRGYLRRPELTEARFIPNPFAADGGPQRLYRSGDLVIPLPGGDMQYIGRADAQVKIRGFRVELGEIESVLVRHEAVKDAAVALRDEDTEFAKLVAYVIPSGEAVPSLKDVRAFLARSVPEYMLPNAIVAVTEMPTTPSGKLDRKKLPWPAKR
jgi:amino acid adenylation domain-containing protein